jgi:DNA-binding MarR family transcriptional regulator
MERQTNTNFSRDTKTCCIKIGVLYISFMEIPANSLSINYRIREGMARVAMAMRVDDWTRSKPAGLNPTQLAILSALASRAHAGLGVKEIAGELGVSQPTATDSINALERKGYVRKQPAIADKRAVVITPTNEGLDMFATTSRLPSLTERSLAALDSDVQVVLLVTLIQVIRNLQQLDGFPVQRMCVTCRFFEPFVHDDEVQPHQCNFVNASFGQRDLRIECREHEQADPAFEAANWETFKKG